MNAREAIQKLREAGFEYGYTEGSHAFYRKGTVKVPVPKHGGRDLKPWEEASIRSAIRKAKEEP